MAKKKAEDNATLWLTYDDAGTALTAMKRYFQKCDDDSIPYGEADLANSLQVKLATLRGWKNGDVDDSFQDAAEWAYQKLAAFYETGYECTHDKVFAKRAWEMMQLPLFQGYKKNEEKTEFTFNVKFGENCDKSDFE